jgi:hypothetical protein
VYERERERSRQRERFRERELNIERMCYKERREKKLKKIEIYKYVKKSEKIFFASLFPTTKQVVSLIVA